MTLRVTMENQLGEYYSDVETMEAASDKITAQLDAYIRIYEGDSHFFATSFKVQEWCVINDKFTGDCHSCRWDSHPGGARAPKETTA